MAVPQPDGTSADSPLAAPASKLVPADATGESMTQHAIIRGEVSFRVGDGVLEPIPDGPADIELTDDSATLAWGDTAGNTGVAAITRDEYERYLAEGKIRLVDHH
jgi:hypothetical protein